MGSPSDSLLDSRPSLAELTKYVKLVSKWYEIGTLLDLDAEELNAIRYSSDSPSDKTISMYQLWLNSDHATRRQLIEVLEGMNLNKQARDYKRYIGKIFSWHIIKWECTLIAFFTVNNVNCMILHFSTFDLG